MYTYIHTCHLHAPLLKLSIIVPRTAAVALLSARTADYDTKPAGWPMFGERLIIVFKSPT